MSVDAIQSVADALRDVIDEARRLGHAEAATEAAGSVDEAIRATGTFYAAQAALLAALRRFLDAVSQGRQAEQAEQAEQAGQ